MKDAKSILVKVTRDREGDLKVTWGRREGVGVECLPAAFQKMLRSPGTYRLTLGNRGCELAVAATGGIYYPIESVPRRTRFCSAFARFLGFKVEKAIRKIYDFGTMDGGWIVTPDTLTVRIKIERVK